MPGAAAARGHLSYFEYFYDTRARRSADPGDAAPHPAAGPGLSATQHYTDYMY